MWLNNDLTNWRRKYVVFSLSLQQLDELSLIFTLNSVLKMCQGQKIKEFTIN